MPMKYKNSFSEIIKLIKRRQGRGVTIQVVDAERDWLIGLLLSLLIIGSVGWWSSFLYQKYSNLSPENSVVASDSLVYRESMVSAVLTEFSERELKFNELTKNYHQALPASTTTESKEEIKKTEEVKASSTDNVVITEESVGGDSDPLTSTEQAVSDESGEEDVSEPTLSF